MAFWGVELKPGRPFIHSVDLTRGRLHISQATLGIGNALGTSKCLVQCNIGDKSPVFLCSLFPERTESCQLNLEFEEVDQVTFSVVGPRSVHLTGYYTSGPHPCPSLNIDSESFGEDIAETDPEKSTDLSDEYESNDSFIDDDEPTIFPPSPVSSCRVTNELIDKKKNKSRPRRRRLIKKYRISHSDEQDMAKRNNLASKTTVILASDSEDEGWFTSASLCKVMSSKLEADVKADMGTSETRNRRTEDGSNPITLLKDDVTVAGELERELDMKQSFMVIPSTVDSEIVGKFDRMSKEQQDMKTFEADNCCGTKFVIEDKASPDQAKAKNMSEVLPLRNEENQRPSKAEGTDLLHEVTLYSDKAGHENEMKTKRKRKRVKESKSHETSGSYQSNFNEVEKHQDDATIGALNLPLRHEPNQKQTNGKNFCSDADKFVGKKRSDKKCKKKIIIPDNEEVMDTEIAHLSTRDKQSSDMEIKNNNADAKSSELKSLSMGLKIEELENGKADGKVATKGKKVSINYLMKLMNGQVVDSNIGKSQMKFRLGASGVIEGLDVGLEGMKVGGKRKLVIPPSMGFGSEGYGEKVPPNSWVVCEVELVRVRR